MTRVNKGPPVSEYSRSKVKCFCPCVFLPPFETLSERVWPWDAPELQSWCWGIYSWPCDLLPFSVNQNLPLRKPLSHTARESCSNTLSSFSMLFSVTSKCNPEQSGLKDSVLSQTPFLIEATIDFCCKDRLSVF